MEDIGKNFVKAILPIYKEEFEEQIFKDFAQTAKEEGTTILMVTHDVHAANYADKCYKIEDGKVEEM